MKLAHLAAALTSAAVIGSALSAQASSIFEQQEVDQSRFVLMATPYQGGSKHQLTIIGQNSDERACWQEQGHQPTAVQPLLLNFDFSGICTRGVDSNGYSIRIDGQDQYLAYTPRIVEAEGELQLIASPARPGLSPRIIARSHGAPQAFSKLMLQPGWRLTQRRYEGKVLGHLYLTHDSGTQPFASATSSIPLSVVPDAEPTGRTAIAEAEIDRPTADSSELYLRQVKALYREVTGEMLSAEAAGRYARLLRNGASLQLLRADMADGDAVAMALSNIYRDLRGTALPDAELRHYRTQIKQGWSLAEVEWDVMQSAQTQSAIRSSRLQ